METGYLINVLTVDDNDEEEHVIAKIVNVLDENNLEVKYLSRTEHTYDDCTVYKFSKDVEKIQKDSISGFFDSENEKDAGLVEVGPRRYVLLEDIDEDYNPSESDDDDDDDDDDDESVVDSDED
jgi:hypothetical protein